MTIVGQKDCTVAGESLTLPDTKERTPHYIKLDYDCTLFCPPAALRLSNKLICAQVLNSWKHIFVSNLEHSLIVLGRYSSSHS